MRKRFFVLAVILLVTLACATTQPTAPATPEQNVETMVAATMQAWTANAPPPATISATAPANGPVVSFENVNFILPKDVASNALAGTAPAVINEEFGWGNAPEHIKFELDGYALYSTFHEPQILVYPAQEYTVLSEGAGRCIAKLQAILNGSAAPMSDNLPCIASFNAGQLFAAQIRTVKFANGSGVRFLTEYGQYFATANNHDLFYQFQGLTDDGKYYILAILPVSHPLLAFDDNPETIPPTGGIPFPGYDNESAMIAYYDDVILLLDSAADQAFQPALTSLDALIQSINIAP